MTHNKCREEKFLANVFVLCGKKSARGMKIAVSGEQIEKAASAQAQSFLRNCPQGSVDYPGEQKDILKTVSGSRTPQEAIIALRARYGGPESNLA